MANSVIYMTLLYDFYGELLTDNQKNIFDLYYNQDLSFSEISENINVSRQGVYDTLKRAEKTLNNYESKLSLVNRFIIQKSILRDINLKLDNILDLDLSNEKIRSKLIAIKSIIKEMI